jgi:hypothetical protein
MKKAEKIRLGYEVGTGAEVDIPLAHTYVAGQTQLSGKTTTLVAIVDRAAALGRRALAFVTKRGEKTSGRLIRPYLPREGDQPIHWRLVESIIASALGQQSMRNERLLIINAARDARSLADVRRNVERLKNKSKGRTADDYMLVGEYLDLVLPEMKALRATDKLDLRVGLNMMDLSDAGPQMQAIAIRAALEHINTKEHGVLTVFPEAWEFAPRERNAPAKSEAIAMARKGSALGNFLLCDSQDIAGVDTVIRGAASVWLIGVQREANELKRTLDVVKSSGIKPPKPSDVATLGIGQFFACWGSHAIKTYVQPAGMSDAAARDYALRGGERPEVPVILIAPTSAVLPPPVAMTGEQIADLVNHETNPDLIRDRLVYGESFSVGGVRVDPAAVHVANADDEDDDGCPVGDPDCIGKASDLHIACEPPTSTAERDDNEETPESEDELSTAAENKLDRIIELLEVGATVARPGGPAAAVADEEALYRRFKERLTKEAPALLRIVVSKPHINVEFEPSVINLTPSKLDGKIGRLIVKGFFDKPVQNEAIHKELKRLGVSYDNRTFGRAMSDLATWGALTIEDGGYQRNREATINGVEKK